MQFVENSAVNLITIYTRSMSDTLRAIKLTKDLQKISQLVELTDSREAVKVVAGKVTEG